MIRLANEHDALALKQVRTSLTDDEIKTRLEKQNRDEAEYLVLETDGQIVSFVFLNWLGKKTLPEYPDMEDLYTKQSERGQGNGTALIMECERLAKKKGFTKIGLAVNPELNDPAYKLYEKLGYRHDGSPAYIDGVYNGIEDWCINMEKKL